MAWYKITCQCSRCGFRWSRKTTKPDSPDPPCPNLACGEVQTPIGMDYSSNRAPGITGGNTLTKAYDETAQIVMDTYGMTDMRDDRHEGETSAPKLPPAQQAAADNYFGGPKGARRTRGFNGAAHAAAALSGRLTDPVTVARSIGTTHANRIRPPVHILNRQ
jgi:hypothetical protein